MAGPEPLGIGQARSGCAPSNNPRSKLTTSTPDLGHRARSLILGFVCPIMPNEFEPESEFGASPSGSLGSEQQTR